MNDDREPWTANKVASVVTCVVLAIVTACAFAVAIGRGFVEVKP